MTDEGYIKFQCHWTQAPSLETELIAELNDWRDQLYRVGFIGFDDTLQVSYGNLSARARGSCVRGNGKMISEQ